VIGQLLPDMVQHCEAWTDEGAEELFPEERAVIAGAVVARRLEFTTVRTCARTALAALGHPAAPLLPGERGAPGWPAGIVGSMTHCTAYRAAAVADVREVATLGIDAEPAAELPDGVLVAVARPEERAMLQDLPAGLPWDRVLFSAKESVYKAWFPVARRFLDFTDASLVLGTDGAFTVRLLVPAPPLLTDLTGRWVVAHGVVATAVVVPVRS
jgi:4'-phosphopantetheinyl transferase EntD